MQVKIKTWNRDSTNYRDEYVYEGVLPSYIANAFGEIILLNTYKGDDKEDIFEGELTNICTKDSILCFLSKFLPKFPIPLTVENKYYKEVATPIGFCVPFTSGEKKIFFLPPALWPHGFNVKAKPLNFNGDNTIVLQNHEGEVINQGTEEEKKKAFEKINNMSSTIEWLDYQASQSSTTYEEEVDFKGVKFHKKEHALKKICERLEEENYMFFFEAPFNLPGDNKSPWKKRRMDLMVFRNQTAVAIEIDGSQHNEYKQRGDDYERDSLIGKHWLKMRRFRNTDITYNIEQVMETIRLMTDPRTNTSSL